MSEIINNTAVTGDNTSTQDGKTFTQDDVNRIIGERLAKEKLKAEAEIAQKEQEIKQRELLLSAKERLTDAGLPVALYEALNVSSPEALERSLEIIKTEFTRPKKLNIKGAVPGEAMSGWENDDCDTVRGAFGLK